MIFLALTFMVFGAGFSSSIAKSKGRDAVLFGVFGALFPIITIIVAICVTDRSTLDVEVRL